MRRGRCIYVWRAVFVLAKAGAFVHHRDRALSQPEFQAAQELKNSLPNVVPRVYIYHFSLATAATFTSACRTAEKTTLLLLSRESRLSSRTELKCPHSYYDDNHYCAMEFRCYLDDSDPNDPTAFSYTLHDDC